MIKQNSNFKLLMAIFSLTIILGAVSAFGHSLHPNVKKKLIDNGEWDEYVAQERDLRARGIGDYGDSRIVNINSMADPQDVDTVKVLILLVDFSDNAYTSGAVAANVDDFDSLLFSLGENPTGSMTEFYLENSYGNFFIQGEVYGWFRLPLPYSYYVDGQRGFGNYPQNAQKMTEDAIAAADATVDFSQFDNMGSGVGGGPDGYVDGLFVVHAGSGYEESGNVNEIHSHAWNINNVLVDGVLISRYSMEPEESAQSGTISPIGVYCHEYGHVLGLPDLYDIDGEPSTSDGVGDWSVMAGGSYNGESRRPAHFDAWCKSYLGFVSPVEVASNMTDVEFPQVESEPVVYKLWANGNYSSSQYFLVENRQLVGSDAALRGSGLLIYHVDDSRWGNYDPAHYHVAVEQADGNFDLEYTSNDSDDGDPYPGSDNVRSFDDLSVPDSRSYIGAKTQVSVWNISDSDSLMTANLDVTWSRPSLVMDSTKFDDGNADGNFDPGESISFYFYIKNAWLDAQNATITMTCSNPEIVFGNQSVFKSVIPGNEAETNNNGDPITFTIPDPVEPVFDTFYIEISSDGGAFVENYEYEYVVGTPNLLIVDDDRGDNFEEIYYDDFYRIGVPSRSWTQLSQGTPDLSDLTPYDYVIWFTGDTASDLLQTEDIAVMKDYLDNGGNLFLTGQMIAEELSTEDPDFLANYLHANYNGFYFNLTHNGIESSIFDGLSVRYTSFAHQSYLEGSSIVAANGGVGAFEYSGGPVSAVTYNGGYKVVFFCWGYEDISNDFATYDPRDSVLSRIIEFFGDDSPPPCDCDVGNADNTGIFDLLDILALIKKIYDDGDDLTPYAICNGDANCDCALDLLDILYLITTIYDDGPHPCSCEGWVTECGALH